MIMNKIKSLLILPAIILISGSCSVFKPGRMPELNPDGNLFRETGSVDSSNIADLPWKELFTDPHLQVLIEQAVNNNPDMKIAMARINRAEAFFKQSRAELFPSLNAGFSAAYQSRNEGLGFPELYQLYGSTSWEADIWGKLRSTKRANLASLLASEAFRRAVMTRLVASVAINYYTLLSLDVQLAITRQTLEKRIRNVETMKALKESDVVTGADLVLSEANRYSAEVIIPDLTQRLYETENALCVITGKSPGPVERGKLEDQDLSPDLSTGIPAQLLANRPDVKEAEYRLRSSFEMIKAARSYFYPSLTITGRRGLTQTDLSSLFSTPVLFWNLTGSLVQPVFNYGLNMQRLRISRADFEEQEAIFRRTLLGAGEEVANAMHAYETATEKIGIRSKQLEFLEKSVDYTMELLKYTSNTNYIDVLTSEVNLLSAQLGSVNDKLEQLQSIVTLYQSLGGGWK